MSPSRDTAEEYLNKLERQLRVRDVKCELVTTGCAPRLRLDIPWLMVGRGELADSAFEDAPPARWLLAADHRPARGSLAITRLATASK
jgi:hypothetical protein